MLGHPAELKTRYSDEILLMRELGWSWRELMETPADLVDELLMRILAERHWTSEKRKLDEAMRGSSR